MHLPQHIKLRTRKTVLALEVKFYLDVHWGYMAMATNADQLKWRQIRISAVSSQATRFLDPTEALYLIAADRSMAAFSTVIPCLIIFSQSRLSWSSQYALARSSRPVYESKWVIAKALILTGKCLGFTRNASYTVTRSYKVTLTTPRFRAFGTIFGSRFLSVASESGCHLDPNCACHEWI